MVPVNQKRKDFGLQELPGASPGSGEPKKFDSGYPELAEARPGSGEPKTNDPG